jgi:hypothetical protein
MSEFKASHTHIEAFPMISASFISGFDARITRSIPESDNPTENCLSALKISGIWSKFMRISSAQSPDHLYPQGFSPSLLPSIPKSPLFGWHKTLGVLGIGACDARMDSQ